MSDLKSIEYLKEKLDRAERGIINSEKWQKLRLDGHSFTCLVDLSIFADVPEPERGSYHLSQALEAHAEEFIGELWDSKIYPEALKRLKEERLELERKVKKHMRPKKVQSYINGPQKGSRAHSTASASVTPLRPASKKGK